MFQKRASVAFANPTCESIPTAITNVASFCRLSSIMVDIFLVLAKGGALRDILRFF